MNLSVEPERALIISIVGATATCARLVAQPLLDTIKALPADLVRSQLKNIDFDRKEPWTGNTTVIGLKEPDISDVLATLSGCYPDVTWRFELRTLSRALNQERTVLYVCPHQVYVYDGGQLRALMHNSEHHDAYLKLLTNREAHVGRRKEKIIRKISSRYTALPFNDEGAASAISSAVVRGLQG
jgi:hypothetical protein